MRASDYDGLVLASVSGDAWVVRERGVGKVLWYARSAAASVLGAVGMRIPVWCQVGRAELSGPSGRITVRIIRDADAVLTWIPDREEGWWSR